MAAVASLNPLLNAHQRYLAAKVNGFEQGLELIAKRLKDVLAEIVYGDPVSQKLMLRQVVHLQVQLRSQLNTLGYTQLAQEFVSGYVESDVYAMRVLGALGKSELILSPMLSTSLQNLRSFDLQAFEGFGNQAVQQISRELTLNVLVGKKRLDVIESLQNNLKVNFDRAAMYADTSIRSYDRIATMGVWEEAGIDTFRYFGPSDLVTRPFCKSRVGKVYTIAQIKAMNNGSKVFGDVIRYAGGPRCRHTFQPYVG